MKQIMVKVGETEMIVLNNNGLVSYILLKQKKKISVLHCSYLGDIERDSCASITLDL